MLGMERASHWALIVGRGNNKACSYSAAGVPAWVTGVPAQKRGHRSTYGGPSSAARANCSRRLASTTYHHATLCPSPALVRARVPLISIDGLEGSTRQTFALIRHRRRPELPTGKGYGAEAWKLGSMGFSHAARLHGTYGHVHDQLR